MGKEKLPLTNYVEQRLEESYALPSFDRFRKHVEPLGLKARGDVLIIGPGDMAEELVLIEPYVVSGTITSITTLGSVPVICRLKDFWRKIWPYEIEPEVLGFSFGVFFDDNPDRRFDTIMFIGITSGNLKGKLTELATRLNPGGRAYLTINCLNSPPVAIPNIDGCSVKFIPNIPTNPNYDTIPFYFGVVIEK